MYLPVNTRDEGNPILASYPGSRGEEEERGWYTPIAHACNLIPTFLDSAFLPFMSVHETSSVYFAPKCYLQGSSVRLKQMLANEPKIQIEDVFP